MTVGLAVVDGHRVGERRVLLPAEHHGAAQARRLEARRDVTDDLAADPDRRALDRRRPFHRQPNRRRRSSRSAVRSNAVRPMKSALSSFTAQSMFEPPRGGVHLGVHADDHVALLQAQGEQRLQPVRPHAEVAAGGHQRLPQLDRMGARVVQLEARLAGERQAQYMAGNAGDIGVDVLQEARRLVEPDAAQQLGSEGSGDVDGAEGQACGRGCGRRGPTIRSSRGSTPRRTTRRRR